MKGFRTAILGAGGYIGQEFARLLSDHPEFETPLLASGGRSSGRRLEEVWQLSEPVPSDLARRRLVEIGPGPLSSRVDVAFSALPSGTAGPIESSLARRGVPVFSNAADHRLDPRVPLLIPEVNPAHLGLWRSGRKGPAPIVTNPNCSVTGLLLALAPLIPVLDPEVVHVATYQSLSGAGYPGVPSLSVTDNVLPHIPDEEEKISIEGRRILGRMGANGIRPKRIRFLAHCARVGVREGHLEAVTVRARRRATRAAIETAWRSFDPLKDAALVSAPHPPVVVRTEADRPQPLRDRWAGVGRARGMAAVVGRLRWEAPYARFFVLSHNAVRGGAGGSVLNAEFASAQGYLTPRRD
ncbi:MAG TPA: aspartate-semialdehyde dehydrogenase [Thermoplasmata archaeon]|nr:aspartate-semialdehyde dehydrogenase [Thermoplasmata archaeon]